MKKDGMLIGINANYVDDLLRAERDAFRQVCRKTHRKFEMEDEERTPFFFAGFHLQGGKEHGFEMDQDTTSRN